MFKNFSEQNRFDLEKLEISPLREKYSVYILSEGGIQIYKISYGTHSWILWSKYLDVVFVDVDWILNEWGTTDIQSCPIKVPPLCRAPAVWVVPVWLIHAGVMPFICDSYRTITTKILSIHFNYLFLLLLISLITKATCKAVSFYIRGFIYTSSPTKQMAFSVGVMVSSLIQISTRSATINKPKGADKG